MDNETAAPIAWIAHKPEQRLSIAVGRFLARCLSQPHYITALHDADGTKRTNNSRTRDKTRGVKSGQLDWDVVQGEPHLARKLELKRGKNTLSDQQKTTFAALEACGAAPVLAYSLREVFDGLRRAGFRFEGNSETQLALLQAQLDAWDRTAELTKAGLAPVKKKKASRKRAEPRFLMKKATVRRLRSSGIML